MPRPQFSIRTLLWLTLVVAAFFGGVLCEKERAKRSRAKAQPFPVDFVYGVHERDLGEAIDGLAKQFGERTSKQSDE
jgi:non-ribosomal peptide synthetase component F